ncbi:RNA polymerase sigma factor [Microlunatus spumicola]|uniref:RNA polymerase sigma factor n=1 Tax=Microlunatus spumicola TaxID=81499 RepID=A0ABP6X395_9ACTN
MRGTGEQVAEVVRLEGARVLAVLVRHLGDWSLAEEAVQEAALAALQTWPERGVPDEPRAWLTVTARRKAIDLLRRERARGDKERASVALAALSRPEPPEGDEEEAVDDDLLRLVFTCCHPSLAPEARLALTLKTLCQLTVAEVAEALLTTETAMARRLTRTKHKIAAARIPYRTPGAAELPERLTSVCSVVHAMYTAGHAPHGGELVVATDLCAEAVRLARQLVRLMPGEAGPAAVLALLLLTEARRPARVDAVGDPVLLADQDRSRWDARLVAEGTALLSTSLRRSDGIADPFQLQAAVALEHDRAPSYAGTDWTEVVRLYDLLVSVAPSAPARLARGVAVAERDGPEAGLRAVADLPADVRVRGVRSELLARCGRYGEALAALEPRPGDVLTEPERRFRDARRRTWTEQVRSGGT